MLSTIDVDIQHNSLICHEICHVQKWGYCSDSVLHIPHTQRCAHKTVYIYSAKMVKIGQNSWRLIQKLKIGPCFIWYYDFIPIKVWENHNDTCHISCNTLDIRCWIYRGMHAAVTQNSLKSCTLNIFWKFWIDFFC